MCLWWCVTYKWSVIPWLRRSPFFNKRDITSEQYLSKTSTFHTSCQWCDECCSAGMLKLSIRTTASARWSERVTNAQEDQHTYLLFFNRKGCHNIQSDHSHHIYFQVLCVKGDVLCAQGAANSQRYVTKFLAIIIGLHVPKLKGNELYALKGKLYVHALKRE